jgi:rRNA maturation RNase YbeY
MKVKEFLSELFMHEHKAVDSVNYIFCSDEYLLGVNKEFLQHSYYTDIITFDLSEGSTITGEIYVSIERVRDNALQFETTFRKELYRVLIHGVLHLVGYKDKTKSEIAIMRNKEEHYLQALAKKLDAPL